MKYSDTPKTTTPGHMNTPGSPFFFQKLNGDMRLMDATCKSLSRHRLAFIKVNNFENSFIRSDAIRIFTARGIVVAYMKNTAVVRKPLHTY